MIRKQKLPNGLVLLTESMPHVRSVSIGVWLRRGSRHETAPVNGISHFIEHLVFKGTETRSARDIALAMDSVGGHVDAFTSKETTCYCAKVLDEHAERAVELLADLVQRPRFDPSELERERQVVLEEIRMVEDTPDELLYDLFSTEIFAGQTLGRPIQGTEESVGRLGREQLLRYFRRQYRPQNMLIAAAGNLRHASMARLVRRYFGAMSPEGAAGERRGAARPRFGQAVRAKPGLEQAHLMLGLPAFREGAPERFPLHVFNTLLGGATSSRLFQRIREERGLAYSVYSAVHAFRDTGILMIYAATGPKRARELLELTLDELRQLRDDGPTRDEFELAREHVKGSLMLSLESTGSRMANLARQEIYLGRQQSLAETLGRVERVTRSQVRAVARRLLGGKRVAFAGVGPQRAWSLRAEALTL